MFGSVSEISYTRLHYERVAGRIEVAPISFPETYADWVKYSPTFALTSTYSFTTFIRETGVPRHRWQSRYAEIRFEPEDQDFFLRFPAPRYFFLQMVPDDPVAQAYAPALAAICDLNLNFDLRIVLPHPPCLPVLQALTASALHSDQTQSHTYLFNAEWACVADWSPVHNELSRVPKQHLNQYDTLRLQLNSRRNQPLVRGVRRQLERSLPEEADSGDAA